MSLATIKTAVVLAAVLAVAPLAHAQDSVLGDWFSPQGDAKVRIAPCGDSVCGKFIWFRDAIDSETGRPLADDRNPDRALRGRPLLGLTFLSGFRPGRDGRWLRGRIYDPTSGHTWGSRLSPAPGGRLRLEGCLGPICKGQIWQPATREASRN
jgi:uncharacterized protein (DUF2147 family)